MKTDHDMLNVVNRFFSLIVQFRGSLAVLLLTLILTLLAFQWMGYDLKDFATAPFGDEEDTLYEMYALNQAITNLLYHPSELGRGLYFADQPQAFMYGSTPYAPAVLMLPVYLLTDGQHVLVYNIYFTITFLLTAWSTYLLVRYVLKAPWHIGLIAGLLLTFSQYRFLNIYHMSQLSTFWFVFALLSLHRMVERPTLLTSIGLAVFFWGMLLTGGYEAVIFIIVLVIFGLYLLIQKAGYVLTRRHVLLFAFSAVCVLVLASPFILLRYTIPELRQGYPMETMQQFSATPAGWFTGSSLIYRDRLPWQSEGSVFIGIIPLVLTFVAWRLRKTPLEQFTTNTPRVLEAKDSIKIYAFMIVAGYLLSLGPIVEMADTWVIPAPYWLLMTLPGFSNLRAIARFILLAVIGTAMLSAAALNMMQKRLSSTTYTILLMVLIGIATLELLPFNGTNDLANAIRLPLDQRRFAPHPREFLRPAYQWLAQQPEDTAVMNLPFGYPYDFQYFADLPLHGRPMLNAGGLAYLPDWYRETDWSTFPSADTLNLIAKHGVDTIFVHRSMLTPAEQTRIDEAMADFSKRGLTFLKQFDDIDVYQLIPVVEPGAPLATVEFTADLDGDNWHGPEVNDQGVSFRWSSAPQATIRIPITADGDVVLMFRVYGGLAPNALDSLRVSVVDTPIEFSRLGESDIYFGVIPSNMVRDHDPLSLTLSVDEVVRPIDLDTASSDTRPLGIALDWLKLFHPDAIGFTFDDSLPLVSGWHEAETGDGDMPFRWMSDKKSTIILPVVSGDQDMRLRVSIYDAFPPASVSQLKVWVNETPVTLEAVPDAAFDVFEAHIPRSMIQSPSIQVTFGIDEITSPQASGRSEDTRLLGLAFTRVELFSDRGASTQSEE